jgi:hypothetical protein
MVLYDQVLQFIGYNFLQPSVLPLRLCLDDIEGTPCCDPLYTVLAEPVVRLDLELGAVGLRNEDDDLGREVASEECIETGRGDAVAGRDERVVGLGEEGEG